jgi:O-antigen ligase
MNTSRRKLDEIGFWLLAACLGVVQFKLLVAQVLFGVALLIWLFQLTRRDSRLVAPAFFLPLSVYALLTLVSAAFSIDPRSSFWDSRQLLLFLIVPMVAHFAHGQRAMRTLDVIIAAGAAGAIVGIVQWAMLGYDSLDRRPEGPLSHYMTYSGVLMLVTCAAVARLVFHQREWIWPAIAVPALLVALRSTLTRNAWLGAAAGVTALLSLRNWKLALLAPLAAIALLFVAPGDIRTRALSMFDPSDPSNRDRLAMVHVGMGMIKDHPVWGIGPEMVDDAYVRYRPAEFVNPVNPHLHNVPLQIAAERGLPALAAWIWFFVAATLNAFARVRRSETPALSSTAFAALVAMLVAGMFEYNFGDSEFLMLLLGLISLPFAAQRAEAMRHDARRVA